MMRRVLLGTAVSGLLAASISIGVALAADGDLDTGFSGDGRLVSNGASTFDEPYAVAVQPDGRIVAAGVTYNGVDSDLMLMRYRSDGTVDSTFGGGDGIVKTPVFDDDYGWSLAIQLDGKLVIAGKTLSGATSYGLVARYEPDGDSDISFGTGGIVTLNLGSGSTFNSVAVQSDGKIVAAGEAGQRIVVVRLKDDGELDETFDSDGKVVTAVGTSDRANAIAIQPDGKIVVAGATDVGNLDFVVVRYLTNGAVDTSFNNSGIMGADFGGRTDEATEVAVDPDGKIVLAGSSTNDAAIARFTTAGRPDNSFSGDGELIADFGMSGESFTGLATQTDGRIVASVGANGASDFVVVRYTITGALDPAFGGGDGIASTVIGDTAETAWALALQPDNNIVLSGSADSAIFGWDFALARFRATSSASSLEALGLSTGVLSPVFDSGVTGYTIALPNSVKTITLSPTPRDRNAVVKVNGATVAYGKTSNTLRLKAGANSVAVDITAQDGVATRSYTVTVTRAPPVLKVKKTMTSKVAWDNAGQVLPSGAKVKITVAKASKKVCSATSTTIKGLKAGTCTVTIAVTPKATKQVKKPKTTRATVTITVN